MNKLNSLVGMQLPEKYKENFDVTSEVLRLELLKTSKFSLYFQVVASIPTKACSNYWHYLHWNRQ
jgi:hypothetical protein